MTGWLFSFGWNWLLVPTAVWFTRGVYVAWVRPRIKLLSASKAGKEGTLLTVQRQEMLPPWRLMSETWLIGSRRDHWGDRTTLCYREGDGRVASESLTAHLNGALAVAEARERETGELAK